MAVKQWAPMVYQLLVIISTILCVLGSLLFVCAPGHWAGSVGLVVALISLVVAVFSYLRGTAGAPEK